MNFKEVWAWVDKRSPDILTGLGIGGYFAAIYLSGKASVEASRRIEERKLDERRDDLSKKEIVETVWKCYIPTAVTAVGATGCIVGAAVKNNRRNAALAAAYSLSQESMQIYREKVLETLGEKKEAEIREKADREMIDRYPPQINSTEYDPYPADQLFMYKDRYFTSRWDKIMDDVYQLGENMLNSPGDPTVTENDFFGLVGLGYKTESSNRGWDLHRNGRPELDTPSCIMLPNRQVCLVISFKNPPIDLYPTRK